MRTKHPSLTFWFLLTLTVCWLFAATVPATGQSSTWQGAMHTARTAFETQRYRDAAASYAEAAKLAESSRDKSTELAEALSNQALSLRNAGDDRQAQLIYQRAVSINEAAIDEFKLVPRGPFDRCLAYTAGTETFWGIDISIPRLVIWIIYLMVTVWAVSSLFFYYRLSPIRRDLRYALNYVKGLELPLDGQTYEKLKREFSRLPCLHDRWEEFLETLLPTETPDGDVVYNTARAKVFLDSESLVEQRLNLAWHSAVPGILTSLGLLGTFGAIFLGLHALHVGSEGQVGGIQTFINNLSGKFLSSLVGLFFAIFYMAQERFIVGDLGNLCVKLQNRLDRLFPQKLSDEILDSINSHIEEQSRLFKLFSASLSNTLKDGLKESMAPIIENMVDAINDLVKATEYLQKEKSETAGEVIATLASEFKDTLTASANTEIKNLATTLQEASKCTEAMNSHMSAFLEHVDIVLANQTEQGNLALKRMEEAFATLLTKVQDASSANMDHTRQSVEDLLAKNAAWSEAFTKQFQDNLMKQAEFNDELQNSLSSSISNTVRDLEAQSQRNVTALQAAANHILDSARQWNDTVGGQIKELTDLTAQGSQNLITANQVLQQTVNQLSAILTENQSVVTNIQKSAVTLAEAITTLSASAKQVEKTQQTATNATELLLSQISKSEQALKGLEQLMEQEKSLYLTLDASLGKVLMTLKQALQEYAQYVGERMDGHLTDFDKHLANACSQLGSTVMSLEEQLSELAEVIERRLPGNDGGG